MEVFLVQRQSTFRLENVSINASFEGALACLNRKLATLQSEDNRSIQVKTPENTQPWHWPRTVYAVDLNQFTAEAGEVRDYLTIEKWELDN
jgi:hypothetical protein